MLAKYIVGSSRYAHLILVLVIKQYQFGYIKRHHCIAAQRGDVCTHHSQQFGNKAMNKSADATIFADGSALPDKKEVQVTQILFNSATRYKTKRGQIDTKTITQRKLSEEGNT